MNPNTAPTPRAGLEWVDLIGVGIYLLVTGAIVIWSSRRQSTTEDYFLGGRRMPWMAVGLSLLATLMSSISYMGVPGEMISNGIAMFWQYLSLPFSMFIVLMIWVPFFMHLKLTSAYEYLELRFNKRARWLGSLLFLLLRLGWMSMVMYVGALSMTHMTASLVPVELVDPLSAAFQADGGETHLLRDTLLYWVIAAIGVSATVYACLGGFRAAIWNDVLQSLMLLVGVLVTLGYVFLTTGTGPSDWWRIASQQAASHTSPKWFSLDPTVRMTVFTAVLLSFFWTICTHGSDQVVLQRYFSTRSLKAARRSYLVNALADLTIGMLLGLCGLALLSFYLQYPNYLPAGILTTEDGETVVKNGDQVLPYFFAHQLPAGIGGVVLAVLLCDAMQTLVSGVNSISAVFANDVFGVHRPGQWFSSLTQAKMLTVLIGLIVTGIGVGVAFLARNSGRNIIDMMAPAFNMFLGPLAALFLIGMFSKCSARTAIPAVLCGVVVSFTWNYWKELFRTEYQPSITLSTAVPYLSSFLIAVVFNALVKEPSNRTDLAFTWLAVMRQPIDPGETLDPPQPKSPS